MENNETTKDNTKEEAADMRAVLDEMNFIIKMQIKLTWDSFTATKYWRNFLRRADPDLVALVLSSQFHAIAIDYHVTKRTQITTRHKFSL